MRKRYSPAFKAEVVLESPKEEKTLAQIASECGVHPDQLSNWKEDMRNIKNALDTEHFRDTILASESALISDC